MRLLMITLSTFAFIYPQIDGDVVKNVQPSQRTDGSKILDISYDLDYNELYTSYDINISIEGGNFETPFYLTDCFGDVFFSVPYSGATKQASCYLTHPELEEILSGEFYINVHANGYATSEIPNSFEFVSYSHLFPGADPGDDNFRFDLYNCDALESNIENIFNYDLSNYPNFEIMKREVTAQQYITFIMDLLSTATSVINYDGENADDGSLIINRTYLFENGKEIFIDNNGIKGWSTDLIYPDGDFYTDGSMGNNSGFQYEIWLGFTYNESGDLNNPYPYIYPITSNLGANDLSIIVDAGSGEKPIINVTFEGALAFAHHYGLRLPTIEEMVRVATPLYNFEDFVEGDYNNEFIVGNCTAANISGCSGELLSSGGGVYGVLPGIDIEHIIGNAAEFTYTRDGKIAFMGQSYNTPATEIWTSDYEICHVVDEDNMEPFDHLYHNYYQLYIESDLGLEITDHTYKPYIGFRCARTLFDNE